MARRFTARPETIQRDLRNVIDKMLATSLSVKQDMFTGEAEIIFDRSGQRYVFRCAKYEHSLDNLRAAQLTISYLWRALEEYGVSSETEELSEALFAQFFLGFSPPPDDDVLLLGTGSGIWWEILGVRPEASKPEIINAYKALAKVHHPDAGGNAEDFRRLREAYEEGVESCQS